MKKYKLKINYTIPKEIHRLKKGQIIIPDGYVYTIDGYNLSKKLVENNPDIFEEIQPLFYTEDFKDGSFPKKSCKNCRNDINRCSVQEPWYKRDCPLWNNILRGQAIYEGDDVIIVYIHPEDNLPFINQIKIYSGLILDKRDKVKLFLNKDNAITYYNELKWKDKLKFKIGDKVVTNKQQNTYISTVIKNIDFADESYKDYSNNNIYFGTQDEWQLYREPKFTTADGVKKYEGDKVYDGRDLSQIIIDGYKIDRVVEEYFDKLENAQQYLAEQIAKKRGIEVSTVLFDKKTKNLIGSTGKTISIFWHSYNVYFIHANSPFNYNINEVLTLEELAKEEGLEIGTKLNSKLLYAYTKSLNLTYLFTEDYYTISEFLISTKILKNKPCFVIYGAEIPIIGFKKFKEKWEAEQLNPEQEANKITFEIGKWYEHKCGVLALAGTKIGFDSCKIYGDNWGIPKNEWEHGDWKLADPNRVKSLLLEKAKKDYPIRTKFKSVHKRHTDEYYISNDKFTYDSNFSQLGEVIYSNNGYLYMNGEWAKIVKDYIFKAQIVINLINNGTNINRMF